MPRWNSTLKPEHWDQLVDENVRLLSELRETRAAIRHHIEAHDAADYDEIPDDSDLRDVLGRRGLR